ncbi:MAG: AprI/Inh family metalloprotease inhibitor [Xanthobacteraceae bacterium]
MRTHLLVCIFALAFAAPAIAQAPATKPVPPEVRALAAQYELTNADATRKCPVTLETKPADSGFLLAFDRNVCGPLFGFLSEVAVWNAGVAGAILLVAPDGRTVTEFTEGVGGVYEAIRENDAVYFLANLQFVDPATRVQISDLYGEWKLSRPDGTAICRITLTDEVAGNEQFTARVQPKCDAAITQFGPAIWQLERGDVVLRSATGESLRFERQESGAWAKVPDKPRPLLMSRP